MSQTMHIQSLYTRLAILQIRSLFTSQTRVKYTAVSELPDWEGDIVGDISGTSSSPYYTSQIPNVQYSKEVIIGNTVTNIGDYAFYWCESMTSIAIPDSVTSIGNYTFLYCSGLTSVTIPNSVTNIGNYAFQYCSSITDVTIGDGVTSIGNVVFSQCTNLERIYFGRSFTSYGTNVFQNCNKLQSFSVSPENASFQSVNGLFLNKAGDQLILGVNGNVTIPNGVTTIANNAFNGKTGLLSVVIPDSVTSIGSQAFINCSSLTSLTFPSNLANIGMGSLRGCSNCSIFDFRTATQVPSLSNVNAFLSTPSNKEIIVPDSLYDSWKTSTNWSSTTNNIVNCIVKASQSSLGVLNPTRVRYTQASGLPDAEFTIIGTLTGSDSSPYYTTQIANVDSAQSIQIGDDVSEIVEAAFYGCSSLTSITIPNNVTSVSGYTFSYCTSLTSVTIGTGITSIKDSMFNHCESLTNVSIPSNITSIEEYAFNSCYNLGTITLPDEVTSIEMCAFQFCNHCPRMTFGSGLTSIGDGAFYGCALCQIFDFRKATSVPTLDHVHAFYNTPSNKEIIVPDSLYDSWKASTNWSSTTNNIVNCIVKASQSSLGVLA